MSGEISKITTTELQEAYAAKNIAQTLRKYMEKGSPDDERKLVEDLNENPTFLQRFFPTFGKKVSTKINAEALQQIRKNKSEVMEAHHNMYIAAVNLQSDAIIKGLGIHLQNELVSFAEIKIKSIVQTVSSSRKEMIKKFSDDEDQANIDYATKPKYLEMSIKQIDKETSVYLESMEELLDGAVKALKNKAGLPST